MWRYFRLRLDNAKVSIEHRRVSLLAFLEVQICGKIYVPGCRHLGFTTWVGQDRRVKSLSSEQKHKGIKIRSLNASLGPRELEEAVGHLKGSDGSKAPAYHDQGNRTKWHDHQKYLLGSTEYVTMERGKEFKQKRRENRTKSQIIKQPLKNLARYFLVLTLMNTEFQLKQTQVKTQQQATLSSAFYTASLAPGGGNQVLTLRK